MDIVKQVVFPPDCNCCCDFAIAINAAAFFGNIPLNDPTNCCYLGGGGAAVVGNSVSETSPNLELSLFCGESEIGSSSVYWTVSINTSSAPYAIADSGIYSSWNADCTNAYANVPEFPSVPLTVNSAHSPNASITVGAIYPVGITPGGTTISVNLDIQAIMMGVVVAEATSAHYWTIDSPNC